MQKINVVCVGKVKEEYIRGGIAEYSKRLSRFARVEIYEAAEGKTLSEEGVHLIKNMRGKSFALCVEGEKISSEEFARKLKVSCDKGEELTFIIGSSCGLAPEVKRAADERISFSDMTFPHQLMRLILLEQIYRAFMINAGSEYHK